MRPYAAIDNNSFDARDTDCGGNVEHARPGRCGNLPGKGGDIHATSRNTKARSLRRTAANKRARGILKRDLAKRIEE